METIITAAVAAAMAAMITWLIVRGYYKARLKAQEDLYTQAQANYEKGLAQMKETIVASMTVETEKLLRRREKELAQENHSSMDGILKPLKESISAMEKAMSKLQSQQSSLASLLGQTVQQ